MRTFARLVAALIAGTGCCVAQAQRGAAALPVAAEPSKTPPAVAEDSVPTGKPSSAGPSADDGPSPPAPVAAGTTDGAPTAVTVTAQRARGAVASAVPAERILNTFDIRAYGANNLEDLLQALQPQVASNRGRDGDGPVTLLNGRRVSDLSEIARIPAEAIERVEIFPEEVALQYGFRADQKVVNIVTFARYRARTAQVGYLRPTEGGQDTLNLNGDFFSIRGDTRINVSAAYGRSSALLESERGIVQLPGAVGGGRTRTLLPRTEQGSLNAVVSGNVLAGVASTVTARFDASASGGLLGLDGDRLLARDTDFRSLRLGTTHNGQVRRWNWSLIGNHEQTTTRVRSDVRATGADEETARARSELTGAEFLLTGPVVSLPAGPASLSLRTGVSVRDFASSSRRSDAQRSSTGLSRDRAAVQASLAAPLTRRGGEESSWLGGLAINANVELERLSDVGSLVGFGYGLNWAPTEWATFNVSATREEIAPTVEQLGGAVIETPNARVFDFRQGTVVDVSQLSGGNPTLRTEDRRAIRWGLSVRPIGGTDLTVSADYLDARARDPIVQLPILTPGIEATFLSRFARDPTGRLLRVDARPINFARAEERRLRWGANFTRPLGTLPPELQGVRTRFLGAGTDLQNAVPAGGRVVRAEPGSAMARRAENMASRMFISVYHTWTLRNRVVPRSGSPVIDFLDGAASDLRGGTPGHRVEAQAGIFKRGLGARVDIDWRNGTTVRSPFGDDLRFAALATIDATLFVNFAEHLKSSTPDWLRGTRVVLRLTNILNSRPQVRVGSGNVPTSYQPAYLDPVGRSLSITVRKIF